MSMFKVKEALDNPLTSATLLHTICLRKYGEDWYMWDPSTVYLELRADFSTDLPAENMDKLSAIQVLISSDAFFNDLATFFAVCSTLGEGDPMFDVFSPPSIPEISWAVAEASLNREFLPFSRSIKETIKLMGKEYGYTPESMPLPLKTILSKKLDETDLQDELEEMAKQDDIPPTMAAVLNNEEIHSYMLENLDNLKAQFVAVEELDPLLDGILDGGVIPTVHNESDESRKTYT